MQDRNHPTPQKRQPSNIDGRNTMRQRESAANIIRGQINSIYDRNQNSQKKEEEETEVKDPYNKTYNQNEYNLEQYHSAWQKYYQQYYQRYYLHQVNLHRQQLTAQKAKEASQPKIDHQEEPKVITGGEGLSKSKQLKQDLLNKIKEQAKKTRQSHHFTPIVTALIVGLLFLFLQYNRFLFAEVHAYVSPGSNINESDTILVDPTTNLNVGPEPKLIIPKINVNIHVVYDITSLEDGPVQEGLSHGVVHYKLPGANSLPGQVGNSVILGHSSNDIFDPGDYKFAFVLLDKLQQDDIFYMHYEGTRYIYKVTDKKIIKPSEISTLQIKTDKPMMTLVTCTPLGTATNRLLVFAEQISPDPAKAKQPSSGSASDDSEQLPGNSPTLFERIKDFFF